MDNVWKTPVLALRGEAFFIVKDGFIVLSELGGLHCFKSLGSVN